MSTCKCKHPQCQYETFLNKQIDNKDYFSDKEHRCIFHSETLQKEKKKKFLEILQCYIDAQYEKSKKVVLKDTVFYVFKIDVAKRYNEVILKDVVFECYPNFDSMQCFSLVLKECSFHEGGRFKRVEIDNLEVRLKKVENALVFEVGGYAKNGLIEASEGYIKKVTKYTNHVSGSGKVFFVGAKFENEANFTNAMLDDVVFQNCDLHKVFFLNSKVDKTEFRNCIFPKNKIRKSFNELDNSSLERHGYLILFLVEIISIIIVLILQFALFYTIPLLVLTFFTFVVVISEYFFKKIYFRFSDKDHICTYDEIILYKKIDENIQRSKKAFKNTFVSLSELYKNLQINFESRGDFQKGGDFFYSRRYAELISLQNKNKMLERSVLIFHFTVNGFGEKFARPLFSLVILLVISTFIVKPTDDEYIKQNFEATPATPLFLLDDFNSSKPLIIKNVNTKYSVELDNGKRLFGQRQNAKYSLVIPKLKDSYENQIIYILSRITSIITPANKNWYKPHGEFGYFISSFLNIVSWFFIGAFLLAIRNRIRRK